VSVGAASRRSFTWPITHPPKPKYRFVVVSAAELQQMATKPTVAAHFAAHAAALPPNTFVWIIQRRDGYVMTVSEPCHSAGKSGNYAEIVLAGVRMIPAIVYGAR
jgi:hypothetical protein